MTNKKITHYNMDAIDSENAIINIIFGERSNGKTYCLLNMALEN